MSISEYLKLCFALQVTAERRERLKVSRVRN